MKTTLWVVMATSALAACGDNLGGGDDSQTPSDVTAVALPQATAGAMWVDPDAYATIPMHVQVTGHASSVSVSIDGAAPIAATADASGADGAWTAQVDVSTLSESFHQVAAVADHVATKASLGVGRSGIQFTTFADDLDAATPRLHRQGDHLYLTWTDISTGTRVAWLEEIDGAGRAVSATSRVALVGGAGQEDVLYARTALGAHALAVLFQERGGPYKNFFTLVAPDGTPTLAPIALDPADRFGSSSGDVVYDGTGGFDVTWRTNSGAGSSDVRWMHVDEASGAVTGPLVVAQPGMDDPHGGFDAITNVAIEHAGDASLVAFTRYEYNPSLQLEIARCQVATITNGAVAHTELAEAGTGLYWDDDCRIIADAAGPVLVWAAKSLTSSDDNPPDVLVGARAANGELATSRGDGHMMVDAPESREEPWLVATTAGALMAWTDARSYAAGISQGQIQLYVAPVAADLTTGTNVVFGHTHFIEQSGDVHGAASGTNAILTWVDERHGGTVLDPRPEIYLETAWQ